MAVSLSVTLQVLPSVSYLPVPFIIAGYKCLGSPLPPAGPPITPGENTYVPTVACPPQLPCGSTAFVN